ncbi:MAG: glutaminyl-peptide cyclotransferase [Vicinamibacterales bacterium]
MLRSFVRKAIEASLVCLFAATAAYAQIRPLDIGARTAESTLVVVATVADITASVATSPLGDSLIYSELRLDVSETIKGSPQPTLIVTIVGGEAAGTGMHASNRPVMRQGDRAIYFLNPASDGSWIPSAFGQGVLKLSPADDVEQTELTLAEARTLMQQAVAGVVSYTYHVIRQYPHDTSAFTQGLELRNNTLYESTGLHGASTLRQVNLQTGAVLRRIDVPSQYFAEGITLFGGRLFQLTWQQGVGFIYDPATFQKLGEFFYQGEGWGLTHDDEHLIMSDGTSQIRFLDPVSLRAVRTLEVTDGASRPVTQINELEYVRGQIYANIWQTNTIARIDPASGRVTGWFDLRGLLPSGVSADVLNGIAFDQATGRLFVTGKLWPSLFEIVLEPVAVN